MSACKRKPWKSTFLPTFTVAFDVKKKMSQIHMHTCALYSHKLSNSVTMIYYITDKCMFLTGRKVVMPPEVRWYSLPYTTRPSWGTHTQCTLYSTVWPGSSDHPQKMLIIFASENEVYTIFNYIRYFWLNIIRLQSKIILDHMNSIG